ncbi:MAG: SMP-30/gluconolactonase/LRE family protein [Verrucomicrobia bacterium]|nr:SMP-30/gluconolactonase/LRE family protein [Verrucomicrobiota bacterium]
MRTILLLAGLVLVTSTMAQVGVPTTKVTGLNAKLTRFGGEYSFTEGPTADTDGNVYFTDQPNNRILRWDRQTGQVTTYLEPAGRANGMCFDAAGNLLVCADEKNELWLIPAASVASGTAEGKQILASEYLGKKLNGPNDVWCHPDGSLYFTDPFYKRPWWTHDKMPQDGQHVYRLSADRKTLTRVADSLKQPNGIVGTPDGKTLYVADIGDKKTYRFQIQADGSLANKTLFCELGSDGMTLDAEGNLYLTGQGVTVFNPRGQKIDHIEVPDERWTANVCFGGRDRHTLFITASKGFYAIQMMTRGAFKQGK